MEVKNRFRQFGLVGKNISFSFSRKYFSAKFQQLQITHCDYTNFDLQQINEINKVFSIESLVGFNVTIPYKEQIIPFLDSMSSEALEIGAVNVVHITDEKKKIGYNTDGYGFEKSLMESMENLPEHALILGTGGASKAIEYVLKKNKISYTFVSRSPRKKNQILYQDLSHQMFKQRLLIVNTTPLGTYPHVDTYPDIPYHYLNEKHLLYDLVYNPETTQFLKRGIEKGSQIIRGLKMLIYQADKAWEIWNTQP
ncbi:MAG: shikimate dehydrogenase [Flavobacteriaceae bacterium]|nr:shikimate dehydrogenase [Flavobacteriaceae bacterium]MCY4268090.1 shikimate dehydrogenase [Flavobacteriaceae bacterium]MCY4298576.1 shikimate dehydrogenase [Flavobacteriaceae bacterium]